MQVNPENLEQIFVNLDLRFNNAYTAFTPLWTEIATEIQSTGRSTVYPLRAFLPKMREWIGERQVQNGMAYEYTIKNKDYEATISVKRNDIEDDQIGLYGDEASFLGEAAKSWPDEIIFDLLMDGETAVCHDGQYFFDTDHPVTIGDPDSATQSNIFNVTDLNYETLAQLEASAAGWRNERGDSFGIKFDKLVVPTQLRAKANLAVGPLVPIEGAAIQNPMAGAFTVMVAPRLSSRPNEFYLMMTNRAIKPIIWQVRKPPTFTSLDAPTDNNVFFRREYIYGVDARGNAGFGLWFMAVKGVIAS